MWNLVNSLEKKSYMSIEIYKKINKQTKNLCFIIECNYLGLILTSVQVQ